MNMQSFDECLREADEFERLAGLARSVATKQIMTVMASKWRRLASWRRNAKATEIPAFNPSMCSASQTEK